MQYREGNRCVDLMGRWMLPMLLVTFAASCSAYPSSELASEKAEVVASNLKDLFDFDKYQQWFHKQYNSSLEANARHMYYLVNAVKVYASGVAYVVGHSGYYLAENHMSDLTPQELDMMRNKQLAEERIHTDDLDESDDKVDDTKRSRRKKRDVDECTRYQKPRFLSAGMLIHAGSRVTSNNSTWNPFVAEGTIMTFKDQQMPVFERLYEPKNNKDKRHGIKSIVNQLADDLDNLRVGKACTRNGGKQTSLPDEMFVDLTKSGCMFPPRVQGMCGSCYAFASMTMAEWLYCMHTGELVAFSEQYMVDCGKGNIDGMNGCSGAHLLTTSLFIHNFGLEPANMYPYVMRENQCPYDSSIDLLATGYVRMKKHENYLKIREKLWPKALEKAPILVGLKDWPEFQLYGGGIVEAETCGETAGHAMLVVGHGRENGQEFWLIRNSYGTNWGEGGYMKLAKSAAHHCLGGVGYVYGTTNLRKFAYPSLNKRNHRVRQAVEQTQQQAQQYQQMEQQQQWHQWNQWNQWNQWQQWQQQQPQIDLYGQQPRSMNPFDYNTDFN